MNRYLRFGHIPKDKKSKVHKSDAVIREEKGVSVWDCKFINDVPFPLLPTSASESAMADYFYCLLGDKPVYLVEGTELSEKGSAGEPLLDTDISIIREYTNDYNYLKHILRKYEEPKTDVLEKIKTEILDEAEYAYADFDRYKEDILHAESDELPDDDYRYGLERAVEIINKYTAESEG